MNKFILYASMITLFIGCSKSEDLLIKSDTKSESTSKGSGGTQNAVSSASQMTVYANLACDLANGGSGCNCVITESDDDCSVQTDCSSSTNFPRYDRKLHEMFDATTIESRARLSVRITEPELIEALKEDGYPLK